MEARGPSAETSSDKEDETDKVSLEDRSPPSRRLMVEQRIMDPPFCLSLSTPEIGSQSSGVHTGDSQVSSACGMASGEDGLLMIMMSIFGAGVRKETL